MKRDFELTADVVSRLISRIEVLCEDDCWLWNHSFDKDGYGGICIQGRQWRATRAIWTLFFGPLEDEELVLHKCDNPACCNPKHLFKGSNLDNIRDMDKKGRRNPYGMTKFGEEEIRLSVETVGEISGVDLAALLGVSADTVWIARRGNVDSAQGSH